MVSNVSNMEGQNIEGQACDSAKSDLDDALGSPEQRYIRHFASQIRHRGVAGRTDRPAQSQGEDRIHGQFLDDRKPCDVCLSDRHPRSTK
jgi:hypothetical protein